MRRNPGCAAGLVRSPCGPRRRPEANMHPRRLRGPYGAAERLGKRLQVQIGSGVETSCHNLAVARGNLYECIAQRVGARGGEPPIVQHAVQQTSDLVRRTRMLDEEWRLRRLHDLLSLNQRTIQIEWIDKIEAVVGASLAVADLDQQLLAIVSAGASVDIQNLDARLPHLQRFADLELRQGLRRAVVRLEQQFVEFAAKIGPHDTFPLSSR